MSELSNLSSSDLLRRVNEMRAELAAERAERERQKSMAVVEAPVIAASPMDVTVEVRPNVPTSNRFAALNDPPASEQPLPESPPPAPTPKPPLPILFLGGEVGQDICAKIDAACSGEIRGRPFHQFLKVSPGTVEDERKILAILAEAGLGHFRHENRSSKYFKTVVRGLPIDADPTAIQDALTEKGFIVAKVSRMTSSRNKAPLPLYQVQTIRTGGFKAIFAVASLIGSSVTVERYRRVPRIPQCYACQHFGHTSHHCQMGPRCRYCGMQHDSRACPTRQQPETHRCANCNGNHISSSATCPNRPRPPKRELREPAARRRAQPKPRPQELEDVPSLLTSLSTLKNAIADVFGDLGTFQRKVAAISKTTSKAEKLAALLDVFSP